MKRYLLLLLLIALVTPYAAATNVSQVTVLDQHSYIPSGLFMFLLATAGISLCVSYRYLDEMCGFISIITSFAALWTSRSIDYVTGVAIDSSSVITVVHTIYHPEVITVIAIVLFILAILNVYRIFLLSKQDGV